MPHLNNDGEKLEIVTNNLDIHAGDCVAIKRAKTEQDRLSRTAGPIFQGNASIDHVILLRIGLPAEICGLARDADYAAKFTGYSE